MRKSLPSLTNEDLAANPIWLYEGESDATAVVQAVDSFTEPDKRAYIARTKFTLADGAVIFGYCSPTDESGLDYVQPVIIAPSGHIAFWRDPPETPPSDGELAVLLGKSVENVFPCRFESLVPFEGGYLVSVIPASNERPNQAMQRTAPRSDA